MPPILSRHSFASDLGQAPIAHRRRFSKGEGRDYERTPHSNPLQHVGFDETERHQVVKGQSVVDGFWSILPVPSHLLVHDGLPVGTDHEHLGNHEEQRHPKKPFLLREHHCELKIQIHIWDIRGGLKIRSQ